MISSHLEKLCFGWTQEREEFVQLVILLLGRVGASTMLPVVYVRCFGMETGVVTAFADNEIGRLIEDFIFQGGVDTSLIKWVL